MTKVYKVTEELNSGSFTSFVTEGGKVLQTSRTYDNGLQGTFILDPCVDIDPSQWMDSNSSIQDLYWVRKGDVSLPCSIEQVEYAYSFTEPAFNGQSSDRIETPAELLARMGKPVKPVAIA